MDRHQKEFDTRLRRLDRKHRKLSAGYVGAVSHDGLIVPRPMRRRVRVPFAGIALLAVGVIALKGMFYAQLGPETYEARVASLSAGTTVEQVAGWAMQADPLTQWVSQQASLLLKN